MVDRQEVAAMALSIRGARSVQDHLSNVENATRLALDQSQQRQFEDLQELRDEIMASQRKSAELQQALISQLGELVSLITDRLSTPPVVNVPRTEVTLEQQPVNVTVPKTAITMRPTIKIPETQVVIQPPEREVPRRAVITHSDKSTSMIEFGK